HVVLHHRMVPVYSSAPEPLGPVSLRAERVHRRPVHRVVVATRRVVGESAREEQVAHGEARQGFLFQHVRATSSRTGTRGGYIARGFATRGATGTRPRARAGTRGRGTGCR